MIDWLIDWLFAETTAFEQRQQKKQNDCIPDYAFADTAINERNNKAIIAETFVWKLRDR